MILCVDMGNSSISLGLSNNSSIIESFFVATDYKKTCDEYAGLFLSLALSKHIDINEIEGIIMSSVVPTLTGRISEALTRIFKKEVMLVTPGLKTGLRIQIDRPAELGSDLVAGAVGAVKLYNAPVIVADLGTANKVYVVGKDDIFLGVVISPGLRVSFDALTNNAEQLIDVSFEKPKSVIGKNTVHSLNSGAVYGTLEMVVGLARRIEEEIGYKCSKVLTGGYSSYIVGLNDYGFVYNPQLVLVGLDEIYRKNKK